MEHQNRAHARLSASGAERWMLCPGSMQAEEKVITMYPEKPSVHALEGTRAHEEAEKHLREGTDSGNEYIQIYLDYVRNLLKENCEFHIERKVSYDVVVPEGFGTCDAVIIAGDTAHIVDLKYGRGVKVSSVENKQLMLYALGVHQEMGASRRIENYVLHIVQPRINNISTWEVSLEKLVQFGELANQRAHLALASSAPRIPSSSACKWCRAAGTCDPRKASVVAKLGAEFDHVSDAKDLSNEELSEILSSAADIKSFLLSVESIALQKMQGGEFIPGYAVGKKKTNRQWKDLKALESALGEKAFVRVPVGISAGAKMLNKEQMENLTERKEGAPSVLKVKHEF